jgi:ABC-type multidrug transport system ATPase subunit
VYEGGTTALKDLTLSIERGTSFGLLGENVAGYWLEKRELLLY